MGQYDKALELLDSTERIFSERVPGAMRTLECARIYVGRGSVFSTLNRYDEAGFLFEEALKIRIGLLEPDDPLVANSYMQMGNYLTSKGKVDAATRAHQKVIEIRAKSPNTPPNIMTISYFNICRSLLMANKLGEAEMYLAKAEELEPRLERGREQLYHKNLSVCLSFQGCYVQGLEGVCGGCGLTITSQ